MSKLFTLKNLNFKGDTNKTDKKMSISFKNLGTINTNQIDILVSDTTTNKLKILTIFLSYETVVAFSYRGEFVCAKNEWSRTTGKLLNKLEPNKKKRIPYIDLEKYLSNALQDILN